MSGAQRSIVYAIEGIVRFKNKLRLDALGDRNGFGDARVERNEVGKIEGVPAESGGTVGAANLVIIQVGIHQT